MMVSITDRSERIVVFAIFGLAAALRIAAAIVDIENGDRLAIIGPNGAGKTTSKFSLAFISPQRVESNHRGESPRCLQLRLD